MKKITFLALIITVSMQLLSQSKYLTNEGYIWFFSDAPLENIEAHNKAVKAIVDMKSGDIVIKLPITKFKFDKSLMEEHFNENYLESEIYPSASFKGRFLDFQNVEIAAGKKYKVYVKGDLDIHGVTNNIKERATLEIVDNETVIVSGSFKVTLEDYNIKIPKMVIKNIAEIVDINVDLNMKLVEKESQ
ncbi:MAG: YceI family protein [Bacteroidales bacterium]|nr:MAG: YceI family protein [Bacteroidales bacterium]